MNRIFATLVSCILVPISAVALAAPPAEKVKEAATSQSELEKEFQTRLSGSTLAGYFTEGETVDGDALKKDRYQIVKLTKLAGEYWLFQTRIQYGGKDVEVPLPLRVVWADRTPVITLDKVPVPGLGTFSSRVVIDGERYAGTWSGGDHGGQLFGTIEKAKAPRTAR